MNIKKIIAREGLVILSIIFVGFIMITVGGKLIDTRDYYDPLGRWLFNNGLLLMIFIGLPIYLPYLLIRFIIWAIKTLRAKQ